jgi:hypothetical protein
LQDQSKSKEATEHWQITECAVSLIQWHTFRSVLTV